MSAPSAAPRRLALIAAFAALYLIWGSTYLGIRLRHRDDPAAAHGGHAIFPRRDDHAMGLRAFRVRRKSTFAEWRTAFIVGACLLFFGNGGVTIAEQWVPSGLASLLVATVPIYIALLAWLDRLRAAAARHWFCLGSPADSSASGFWSARR